MLCHLANWTGERVAETQTAGRVPAGCVAGCSSAAIRAEAGYCAVVSPPCRASWSSFHRPWTGKSSGSDPASGAPGIPHPPRGELATATPPGPAHGWPMWPTPSWPR